MKVTGALAACSLMVVDDEEANLDLLEGLLLSEGYSRITRVVHSAAALPTFRETAPDVVLLDLHMPSPNGFEILEQLRRETGPDDYLPVLVLTADVTSQARDRALSSGANDFITKPFDAVEVLLRVRNLLEVRLLHRAEREARLAAEGAERHARLLAEASRVLSASLDSETGLAQLRHLLVPEFASRCIFAMVNDGEIRWSSMGGGGGHEGDPVPPELALEVKRSLDDGRLRRVPSGNAETIVAPMSAASGPLGAIVVTPRPDAGAGASFAELLEEIAGRAALAIENARLFAGAQLASRSRERLLAVVAHDLRSPLAVVTMYAEMLLDLLPPDEDSYTADALASIYQSTHRMQQQVEDLLDLGRFQEGTFTVRPAECLVEELFREAALTLGPLADARAIELTIEGPHQPAGLTAEIDALRFLQVLSNLVGNAIKFTPENGRVVVGWDMDETELHVSVSDSGPGIARDQLPHLFGAFWQARDADRRGVGLGLWIARAILEAHGGRIWVDSEVGRGATFHVRLPLRQREQAKVAREDEGGPADEPMIRLNHAPLPDAE